MKGRGAHRPLNNFDSSRFSFEPVLGESASGYNTPDNASVMSFYPPVSSASPYNDPQEARPGRMDMELSSISHPGSEHSRSAFVPTDSGMLRMLHPPIWHGSYMAPGSMTGDEDQSGFPPGRNRSTPYGYSHSLDHHSGPELQHMMNQQRLMESGMVGVIGGGGGGVASKRDSSTDDEMSVYESDGKVPRYRRTSLPERSLYGLHQRQSRRNPRVDGGGMWDFKTRRPAHKGHIPIGRVSPITPTETERVTMASLYSHQLIKDGLKLKSDHGSGNSSQSSQGNLQDSAPITFTVTTSNKDNEKEREEEDEQLQNKGHQHQKEVREDVQMEGEGQEPNTEAASGKGDIRTASPIPLSTNLQDGYSQADCDDDEAGEPPPPPTPLTTSSQPLSHTCSSTDLEEDPQAKPTSPKQVVETDAIIDEALGSCDEHPVPSSSEAKLSQESFKNSRVEAEEKIESNPIETGTVKQSCDSPTRKHSRSSLKSAVVASAGSDRATTSSPSLAAPPSPPSATRIPSSASSPLCRTNSSHRAPHTVSPVSLQSTTHKHDFESRQRHRERSDHSPSRRFESSSPLGMKPTPGKSLKLAPILSEFKKTIDEAEKFGKAMAALAESGSSDQDSDSEPHSKLVLSALPPHESAKVKEKMRAPQPFMKQIIMIRKNPGEVSFGFSIADGQYDLGVYVKTVKPGGPSDRGGLLQYDKINKVNEMVLQPEHTSPAVYALLKRHDRELVLTVTRQAQLQL